MGRGLVLVLCLAALLTGCTGEAGSASGKHAPLEAKEGVTAHKSRGEVNPKAVMPAAGSKPK